MTAPLALLLVAMAARPAAASTGIRWERSFDAALQKARQTQKPVMVDFWAEWCGWCHELDRTTYVDPEVVRLSRDFIAVKVDTEGAPKDVAVALRYDVSSLPTIAFLSPHGRPILRLDGFQRAEGFSRALSLAKRRADEVLAWEQALEKKPEDPAALMKLGFHLFDQELYEESRDLLLKAYGRDTSLPVPDRKQVRMCLGLIRRMERKFAEAEEVLKEGLSLKPSDPEWDARTMFVLGRTYVSWGRKDDARSTLDKLVRLHPGSSVGDRARESLELLGRSP